MTRSSTIDGGDAARAVDGNTDGHWNAGPFTPTDSSKQARWRVEPGAVCKLKRFFVCDRTDCCGERRSDFTIPGLHVRPAETAHPRADP